MMFEKRKTSGFTLSEMIVSIGILMLISSVVLANFHSQSKSKQVRFVAQDLSSVIRKAQLMSQFGRTLHGSNTVPIGGFGIHLEQCLTPVCSYFMFADVDGGLDYDVGEEIAGETHFIPKTMIINTLSETPMDIVFKPPRPFVCINTFCDGLVDAVITLKQQTSSDAITVKISSVSGKVSVEK